MSEQKNWRDKLKEGASNSVKLNVIANISVKANKDTGVPEMTAYMDGNKVLRKSVQGFLLGNYSKFGVYNNTTKRGANSTPYYQSSNIVSLYEDKKRIFSGTVEDAKRFGETFGQVKSLSVAVLATKSGIVTVETNAPLFILEINKLKNMKDDYLLNFLPKLFVPSTDWEKGLPENYKTLNPGMRPSYAHVEAGIPFTQALEDEMDMEGMVANYKEFEAFIRENKSISSVQESDNHSGEQSGTGISAAAGTTGLPASFNADESEDLPF